MARFHVGSIMFLFSLLLPAFSLPFNAGIIDPSTISLYNPPKAGINLAAWQSRFPDSTYLTELVLPGTHDTLASLAGVWGFPEYAQCQSHNVLEQLRMGVRYLDLRFRHFRDLLHAHHGAFYYHTEFNNVFLAIHHFLTHEGAGETLVVRLKSENWKQRENTRTWDDTLKWYLDTYPELRDVILLPPHPNQRGDKMLPTLGEARGKLVLLQEWDDGKMDLAWLDWLDGRTQLQDHWNIWYITQAEISRKVTEILAFWFDGKKQAVARTEREERTGVKEEPPLRINHLSAIGIPDTPRHVNTKIYDMLWMYMQAHGAGGAPMDGIVVGDFMTEAIARAIIVQNWPGDVDNSAYGDADFEMEKWTEWRWDSPGGGLKRRDWLNWIPDSVKNHVRNISWGGFKDSLLHVSDWKVKVYPEDISIKEALDTVAAAVIANYQADTSASPASDDPLNLPDDDTWEDLNDAEPPGELYVIEPDNTQRALERRSWSDWISDPVKNYVNHLFPLVSGSNGNGSGVNIWDWKFSINPQYYGIKNALGEIMAGRSPIALTPDGRSGEATSPPQMEVVEVNPGTVIALDPHTEIVFVDRRSLQSDQLAAPHDAGALRVPSYSYLNGISKRNIDRSSQAQDTEDAAPELDKRSILSSKAQAFKAEPDSLP